MRALQARDEREHAVDLSADRLSFLIVSYGALLIAAYRSYALGEAAWDLLGLVVLGGVAGLAYRVRHGVATRSWSIVLIGTVVIAAVAAGLIALGFDR